jgi:hypothetical protein
LGTKQSIVLPTKSKSLEAITSKVVFLLSVTIALVVDDPPVTATPVKITLKLNPFSMYSPSLPKARHV